MPVVCLLAKLLLLLLLLLLTAATRMGWDDWARAGKQANANCCSARLEAKEGKKSSRVGCLCPKTIPWSCPRLVKIRISASRA